MTSFDTKGWAPTEGHKRAELTVQMLEQDGASTGHRFSPEFRWRMVQIIAGAIDAALHDARSDSDSWGAKMGPVTMTITDNTEANGTGTSVAHVGPDGELHPGPIPVEAKKRGRKPGRRRRTEAAAP